MRFHQSIASAQRLTRMLTSFSVRTRIIVLALIPVAGFLANGLTYISGESDVGTRLRDRQAFGRARRRQPRLQERGRGDAHHRQGFHRQPERQSGRQFRPGACARRCKASTPSQPRSIGTRAENIVSLRKTCRRYKTTSTTWCSEQKILGYDETTACAAICSNAGNAVERIINENMTWLAEADAKKLMMTLLVDAAPRSRIPAQPERTDATAVFREPTRNSPTLSPTSTARRR